MCEVPTGTGRAKQSTLTFLCAYNKSPGKLEEQFFSIFLLYKYVDYRATRAVAGAALLTSWSRVKMEQLHNTGRHK